MLKPGTIVPRKQEKRRQGVFRKVDRHEEAAEEKKREEREERGVHIRAVTASQLHKRALKEYARKLHFQQCSSFSKLMATLFIRLSNEWIIRSFQACQDHPPPSLLGSPSLRFLYKPIFAKGVPPPPCLMFRQFLNPNDEKFSLLDSFLFRRVSNFLLRYFSFESNSRQVVVVKHLNYRKKQVPRQVQQFEIFIFDFQFFKLQHELVNQVLKIVSYDLIDFIVFFFKFYKSIFVIQLF